MKIGKSLRGFIYTTYIICFYIPIYLRLFFYCLKYKTKPTILWKLNPWFPYGGLLGTKSSILEKFRHSNQEFERFFCTSCFVRAKDSLTQRKEKVQKFLGNHAHYPLILKPDDGIGGIGLQYIEDEKTLIVALNAIKKDHILQEYIDRPLELSIFFIKHPGKEWKIWSITRRYTLKGKDEPELIIPTRKTVCKDESHCINSVLEERFNGLSQVEGFYFGRFDIRVKDMQDFVSQWVWFKIIEVNVGAHSMALHAFDDKYSWSQRYQILFDQLKFAFEIARENANEVTHPDQNLGEFFQWFFKIFKNVSK